MDINPFHILYLDTPISSMESLRQWLATLLGPSVTAVGFLFIYQQLKLSAKQARLSAKQAKIAADNYDLSAKAAERSAALAAEQQRWKKAEFLAEQVREFHNDEVVARVIYMLDWYRRFFEIPSENDSASKIRVAVLQDNETATEAREVEMFKPFFKKRAVVITTEALVHHSVKNFNYLEGYVRDSFDWFLFRLSQFQYLIDAELFSYAELEIHLKYILDLISGGHGHVSDELTARLAQYVNAYGFEGVAKLISSRQSSRQSSTASAPSPPPTSLPVGKTSP